MQRRLVWTGPAILAITMVACVESQPAVVASVRRPSVREAWPLHAHSTALTPAPRPSQTLTAGAS